MIVFIKIIKISKPEIFFASFKNNYSKTNILVMIPDRLRVSVKKIRDYIISASGDNGSEMSKYFPKAEAPLNAVTVTTQ